MRHLTEEDLVLLHYGEADAPLDLAPHLAECEACRKAAGALRSALAAVDELQVPERHEAYGAEVWARLAPRLASRERVLRFPTRRAWAALLGAAAGLLVAFEAGRHWPRVAPTPPEQVASGPVRERILLVAVGDHLRRSQLVLVELVNVEGQGPVDVNAERELARNLVANSRLYRQRATAAGDAAVTSVLDDLERVLVEIANGPATLTSQEAQELRGRIESKGILFKVKVLGSQLQEKEEQAVRERAGLQT